MQLTKNIASYEVLPPRLHQPNHRRHNIRLLDKRIMLAWQWFIERWDTTLFNTWKWGGDFDSRGFRPADDPDGAKLSQHKFGRALDGDPQNAEILEVHADILKNPGLYLDAGFTSFEVVWDAETWIHGDCRWHDQDGLFFVGYSGDSYGLNEYKTELNDRKLLA